MTPTAFEEFRIQKERELGRPLKLVDEDSTVEDREDETRDADIVLEEIFGAEDVGKLLKRLGELGFEPEHFARSSEQGPPGEDEEPLFRVETGDDKMPLFELCNLPRTVMDLGKKGIEIQRYKGLGEMNPEQLWATTMDPAVRTLVRVKMDDQAQTDHIFSLLMGSEVEPRRRFIETNALAVVDLDI